MKSINTHGLTIKGLKAACGRTINWWPGSGGYTEVFFDRATGEIWTVDQVSLGMNTWTQYDDPDVIKVCNATTHLTMQQLADLVYPAVTAHREMEEYFASLCAENKEAAE